MAADAIMVLYIVYSHPLDFPDSFVVRRWRVVRGNTEPIADEAPLVVAPTIEYARSAIPHGFHPVPRLPDDDPAILEVWL